jgi:hypothetical protein
MLKGSKQHGNAMMNTGNLHASYSATCVRNFWNFLKARCVCWAIDFSAVDVLTDSPAQPIFTVSLAAVQAPSSSPAVPSQATDSVEAGIEERLGHMKMQYGRRDVVREDLETTRERMRSDK